MNKIVLRASSAAVLVLTVACSDPADKVTSPLPDAPKLDEVYRKELLGGPAEDVRKDTRTAKDFPGLSIEVDPTSKPEGDEVLDYWETGVFHLVYKLSSGKEIKNTYKLKATEEVTLIEGAAVTGMVFGCLGMKKGEVRNLLIPADLAYGEDGDPASGIGPNATLLARVELVELGAELDEEFQIRRVKAGEGKVARNGQYVRMNYTGILAQGEKKGLVFDSSVKEGGEPLRLQIGPLGSVIKGWQQGLQGMKVGERRWLKIPPHMAYGAGGQGETIPPDATLIFEVELMAIDGGGMGMPGGFPGGLGGPGAPGGFPAGGMPPDVQLGLGR